MSEAIRPTFARGWYGYTDDEINVALDAILRPETVPQESHLTLEPIKAASPIVDKTLILAVAVDLIADQRQRLDRLQSQVDVLALQVSGLAEGLHGTDDPNPADARGLESDGMPE